MSQPRSAFSDRLRIHCPGREEQADQFAEDVRSGLSAAKKYLQPKYFYDELGSRLFEAICWLPEYYLTRAEREILRTMADEIVASVRSPARLVELGSGSGEKTRYLIEALLNKQAQLHYLPIDISRVSVELSSKELLRLYPALHITGYVSDYFTAMQALRESEASPNERTIALFLGSNIGNFGPEEQHQFLTEVRRVLKAGDALLLGADLKKSPSVLIPAYDDALGVTAAFNLNLLGRINRTLGGNFDISRFHHQAVYNEEDGRIEIYILSRQAQKVFIKNLDLAVSFEEGERIHTENSYKFDLEQLARLAKETGFDLERTWYDSEQRFSFNLFACTS